MPRNAYFLYMVDFKKQEEAKLGRNLGMVSNGHKIRNNDTNL